MTLVNGTTSRSHPPSTWKALGIQKVQCDHCRGFVTKLLHVFLLNNILSIADPILFLWKTVKRINILFFIFLFFRTALFIMVALWNRADHYIFILFSSCGFFLSSSFFPRIISAAAHWMSIPYFDTWCGPSANLECRSETCSALLAVIVHLFSLSLLL